MRLFFLSEQVAMLSNLNTWWRKISVLQTSSEESFPEVVENRDQEKWSNEYYAHIHHAIRSVVIAQQEDLFVYAVCGASTWVESIYSSSPLFP